MTSPYAFGKVETKPYGFTEEEEEKKVTSPYAFTMEELETAPTSPTSSLGGYDGFGSDAWLNEKIAATRKRLMGFDLLVAAAVPTNNDPTAIATRQALKDAYAMSEKGNKQALKDIVNMFGKTNITDKLQSIDDAVVDAGDWLTNPERATPVTAKGTASIFGTIAALPFDMAYSIASSTFHATTGVSLGSGEVKALSQDEYAKSVKELVGNAAAIVIAPVVSKAVEAGALLKQSNRLGAGIKGVTKGPTGLVDELDVAASRAVIDVANYTPKLGLIGRAMLDDTVAGAVSGVAQGAIATANEEDTLNNAFMGLMFAPLGVATGYFRGVKAAKAGMIGGPETVSLLARDVLIARQLKSMRRVGDAGKTAEGLMAGDNFLEALVHVGLKVNPAGVVHLTNVGYGEAQALKKAMPEYEFLDNSGPRKKIDAKDENVSVLAFKKGGLTNNQKLDFILAGRMPQVIDMVVDQTDMTGRLKTLYDRNPSAIEAMNEAVHADAKTGERITFVGFRMQRGQNIPNTGTFYALTGMHAQGYGGGLSPAMQKQAFLVKKIEFNNPLVLDGKHMVSVRGLIDDNSPLARRQRDLKYEEDVELYKVEREEFEFRKSEEYDEFLREGGYAEDWHLNQSDPGPSPPIRPNNYTTAEQFELNKSLPRKAPELVLTPQETAALKEAFRITYNARNKAHPEQGYQLMDKILARAAKRQGHDGIIYKGGEDANITNTEVVDLNAKVTDEPITIKGQIRSTVSLNGKDYTVSRFTASGTLVDLIDPVTGTKLLGVEARTLRQRDLVSQSVDNADDIGKAYAVFESKIEKGMDYEKALSETLNEHKILNFPETAMEAFNERLHKRMMRELDPAEAAQLRKLSTRIDEGLDRKKMEYEEQLYHTAHSADTNGLYIENNHGILEVRSQEDFTKFFSSSKLDEVHNFINGSGQAVGRNLDTGAILPTSSMPVSGAPAAWTNKQLQELGSTRASQIASAFDAAHERITSFPHYIDGIDRTFGTNIGQELFNIREAHKVTRRRINEILESKEVKYVENIITKNVRKEMRPHITGYIETMTADQIAAPGGIAKQHTLSPQAIAFAKWMNDVSVDPHKVHLYRRMRDGIEYNAEQIAQERANAAMSLKEAENAFKDMSTEEVDKIYGEVRRMNQEKVRTSPEYMEARQQLIDLHRGDKDFLTAVEGFDGIHPQFGVSKVGDIYGATRYTDALREPDKFGLSRSEYAQKHGMTAKEVQAAIAVENWYKKAAREFGVPEYRQLNNYVNHYRQYGDVENPAEILKFAQGIENEGVREFASNMVRTGEIINYQNDPLQAMQSYIRAYVKNKELYPTIDKSHKVVMKEKMKIADPDKQQQFGRNWADVESILTGKGTLEQKAAMAVKRKQLIESGMSEADAVMLASQTNALDTFMNLSNASLMGGRLVMSLRDGNDAIMKKFIFHGMHRTVRMLSQDVMSEKSLLWLKENGIITESDFASIYDPTVINKTPSGMIAAGSKAAATWGYRFSGQGQLNIRVQAAASLEAIEFSLPIIEDILHRRITKEEGYKKLKLYQHDEFVKKAVDKAIAGGQSGPAVKAIAFAERDRMSGQFGMGVAPVGSGTVFGRLFGQMGTWSIQNRSILMKLATKGEMTMAERGGVYARYAISQAAVGLAAKTLGVNLSSWILSPASLVFLGGPAVDVGKSIIAEARAELGGTDVQKDYARRQIRRNARIVLPGGYALSDIEKAYELATEGSGFDFRPLLQAVGVPVKKDEGYRSLIDMVRGNYPFMR